MRGSLVKGRHAKISNLDLEICRDEDILGLQIAMADVEGMAICDGTDDLSEEVDGDLLTKSTLGIDECEQVSLVNVLKNEVSERCQSVSVLLENKQLTLRTDSPRCHKAS